MSREQAIKQWQIEINARPEYPDGLSDISQMSPEQLLSTMNTNPREWVKAFLQCNNILRNTAAAAEQILAAVIQEKELAEDLNAQATQARAHVAEKDAVIRTLKSLLKDFKSAPTTDATFPAAVVKHSSRYKPANLEKFDGTRKDTRNFLTSADILFNTSPDVFSTENIKVNHVAAHLTGKAMTQLRPKLENTAINFPSWELFRKYLLETFGDPNPQLTARNALVKLRQNNREVTDYIADFQALAADANYDEGALIDFLQRGLSDEMKRLLVHEPSPSSVSDFTQQLVRLEQRFNSLMSTTRTGAFNKPSSFVARPAVTRTTSSPAAVALDDTVPMDLSASRRPALSSEEKIRRRQQGLCSYCGKAGHLIKNCPNFRCYNCQAIGHSAANCEKPARTRVAAASTSTISDEEEQKNY